MNGEAVQELIDALPVAACVLGGASRIVAANERMRRLTGYTQEELLGPGNAIARFVTPFERDDVLARYAARLRGEPVPDEQQFTGVGAAGEQIPVRARIAPFPAAGAGAFLFIFEDERNAARTAALIRGFVDTAVAAQQERSQAGLFSVVRQRLTALGLTSTVLEMKGDQFRFAPFAGAITPAGELMRQLLAGWTPVSRLPLRVLEAEGTLVDDLPGFLAQLGGVPRERFLHVPPRAIVAAIRVGGETRFILSCSGPQLDRTSAGAFGLLGRQLGAALETVGRIEELDRKNRELLAVNEVARASAALGSGRSLQAALEELYTALDIERAALFRKDERGLSLAAQREFDSIAQSEIAPWKDVAASGQPVLFALDESGVPARTPGMQANALALPLFAGDELTGVLVASRRGPLGNDDLRVLATVGAQLSVALQNAALLQQTQRRVDELSLLLELGQQMVGTLQLPEVLKAAASIAARALRCDCAYILLPDEAEQVLRVAARQDPEGPPGLDLGSELRLSQATLSGLAYQTKQAYVTSDTSQDARIDPEVARRFRCRATLAVPLLSQSRALGVLAMFERSDRVFDPQDLRLAAHAAQLIAAAVESARLYAEQRTRAEEMALLNEVARGLAGSVELLPLLQLGGETLRRLTNAETWFVMLPNAEGDALVFAAGTPAKEHLVRGVPLRMDEPSLAVTAFRERRPVFSINPAQDPTSHRELSRLFSNRTTLAVPLLARDQVLGAVVLLDGPRERDFTRSELDRAQGVAGQLALAVLSAQLYQDLRKSYEKLAQAQAELIDRERLAALGELSASIAHEVRNPLGVIFNSVGSLRRLVKPEGDVGLLLDIMGEEADRLNRMVGDLLDYSRPLQPALQPVPLRPMLEEALAAAQAHAQSAAEVRPSIRVASEADTVRGDARLLRQALVNLFLNALQAMPRGGQLDVRVTAGALLGRPAALLAIRDSGPGIPAEARARIFQPFFTTKATGTGLGLAVVKRIVEGHGGSLTLAESTSGAEFQVLLPLWS